MIFTEAIQSKRLGLLPHELPDVVEDPEVKMTALKFFSITGAIDMEKVKLYRYRKSNTYILEFEQ